MNGKDEMVEAIKGLVKGFPFIDRVTALYNLVPFVMFFAAAVVYFVAAIFPMCCNGNAQLREGEKNLLDQLSYESLVKEYSETKTELLLLPAKYRKLRAHLEDKLVDIGNTLRKYLNQYERHELLEIDSKELPVNELEKLFHENREKLVKSSINGLYSYKLLVSSAR